jgi:predicted TIM-barrel fold metal-dependent hydrolase
MPRGCADAVAANEEAARIVSEHSGLLQWVIIDPRQPQTYEQADRLLRTPRCMGIKIHPEEHLYPIKEYGEPIFAFAAERRAVVLTHSGEANSLPEDFVPFADAHPEMKLILAHIGCGYDGDLGHQVRAIQRSRKGNIYADTSSAMSIVPNLIEWAVSEVGVDRVLFGTDTPLYHTAMQRTRIDRSELSETYKRRVLRENAITLLPISNKYHE